MKKALVVAGGFFSVMFLVLVMASAAEAPATIEPNAVAIKERVVGLLNTRAKFYATKLESVRSRRRLFEEAAQEARQEEKTIEGRMIEARDMAEELGRSGIWMIEVAKPEGKKS